MKKILLIAATVVGIIAGTIVWLFAAPTIDSVAAAPAYIVINTPTPVLFTARISDSSVISTGVNLLNADANGTAISNLGRMHDDGLNGDAVAGDTIYSIRLTLNETTVGPANYRVSAAFRRVLRRTLSDLIVVHIDPFALPPDPGEAGKQTLSGIDSDGDGVRDDVQRWIAVNHLASASVRAALTQQARVFQLMLRDAHDRAAIRIHVDEQHRADDCLTFLRPSDAEMIRDDFMEQFLNTNSRIKVYLQADAQLMGAGFDLAPLSKDNCDFDPDVLEN